VPSDRVKTDTLFYNLFQTFPSIFFELINHSPEEAATTDWQNLSKK
jgi:predicted transposase YdaD